MSKTVRKGSWYRYVPTLQDAFFNELPTGSLVKVVNVQGGRTSGHWRNVEDRNGNIYFVEIASLFGPKPDPVKFADLYR